jgi:hypothetical protein
MVRLLLLFLTPLAVLLVGAWWSRRFAVAPQDVAAGVPVAGEVPVAAVVRDVLCRLDSRAARQFVQFETAVAETLMVGGDRQALEELLSGLCSHAIETTPCGRVLVTAGHRGGGTAIAIVDDGIGMPTVRTAGVLERSREFLTLLGGKLETHRRQGVGTTMTILLPAHADRAGEVPWNATIRNAMADFARVTETQPDRSPASVAAPQGVSGTAASPIFTLCASTPKPTSTAITTATTPATPASAQL